MSKLRILLLVAALAVTALIGVGTAFAASSGAEASGKTATVRQQRQTPDRDDGRDCPFKHRDGAESEPSIEA